MSATTAPANRAASGEAAVELCSVSRSFGGVQAISDLTLAVTPGELYGLVGPDGAGKTTTIRMMTGLLLPDSGQANVYGQSCSSPSRSLRQSIGYMPQQYSLYGDLSIDENLDFFGNLFGLPKKKRLERKGRLLGITRLERFRKRRADQLSGGMYKKLALACALLHQPRVLVLDEPTNGVDPVSRRELWNLLYEFVDDGMTVVLSSPNMDEAARCHRVGLLNHGQLMAEGEPGKLAARLVHPTYLIHMTGRDQVEDLILNRAEVLSVSPEGSAVRVVVERHGEQLFLDWVRDRSFTKSLEVVVPTFEDVFLSLLVDPEAIASGTST